MSPSTGNALPARLSASRAWALSAAMWRLSASTEFEFLLVADPADEGGDVDRLAVEVAVEVEQKYQERRAVLEHRAHPEIRHPVMLAGDADAHA